MQDVLKSDECVAGNLSDFCLLNEGVVEQTGRVVLLLFVAFRDVLAIFFLFLLGHSSGDVEAHLHKLVSCTTSLLSACSSTTQVSVRTGVLAVCG